MKMIALIEKLAMDADKAWQREVGEERLLATQQKTTPEARLAAKSNELRRLRAHTNAMSNELAVKRQLETEYKRSVPTNSRIEGS